MDLGTLVGGGSSVVVCLMPVKVVRGGLWMSIHVPTEGIVFHVEWLCGWVWNVVVWGSVVEVEYMSVAMSTIIEIKSSKTS